MQRDRLGFRSLFVLGKLGRDLGESLSGTLAAPAEGRLGRALGRVAAEPGLNDGVLDLDRGAYRVLEDGARERG